MVMALGKVTHIAPELVFLIWEDAHGHRARVRIDEARVDDERCIWFRVGWVIKETKTTITIYPNLVTWHSAPYEIAEVEDKITIPKKWILTRHSIRLPKKALKYD